MPADPQSPPAATPRDEPTRAKIERRIAEIEARLSVASPGCIFVAKVDADESNVCIRDEHWDLYINVGEVKDLDSRPGSLTATLTSSPANVGCYLGDESDARFFAAANRDVAWLIARLRSALSVSGTAPEPTPCPVCGSQGVRAVAPAGSQP